MRILIAGNSQSLGLLEHSVSQVQKLIRMPDDASEYARRFYAILRTADEKHPGILWIEMPPDQSEWAAIRDRIRRATRHP